MSAGQRLANLIPDYSTGIEIGWGAGRNTRSYAASLGEWKISDDAEDVPSASGKSFSALIHSLGAPAGKLEGHRS